jgi:hypothetical protein
MVKFHGYPYIDYTVTTLDGYKLSLGRIPAPKSEQKDGPMSWLKNAKALKRQPVIILHGVMSSA